MGERDFDIEEKGGAINGYPPSDGFMREDESVASQQPMKQYKGVKGKVEKGMDFLVKHGVEERGIQPLPENEREPNLNFFSYVRQAVLWAGMNTNILTFSEGMTGPGLYGLDLKTSVGVIVGFNAVMCVFPAYVATNGPKTGMRQMIQARYGLGYFGAMVIGLANVLTLLGYLSLTSILGGQCLSMASGSDMSWTVGIIVLAIIGLCMSFIGLRALHVLAFTFVPIVVLLYIVLIGVTGNKLHYAVNATAQATAKVTASGVLGFCASQVGFTASYSGIASDFTTHFPANTPRLPLFLAVYCGLFIPIVCIQIFGAVCRAAAFSVPSWNGAADVGAPDLLFAMSGSGGGAKFVMVLFTFSVVTNVATTIYSAGLSGQIVLPFLIRVPRYFLAILVTAIYLPIAIVGSAHFFDILRNFLAVLGYWTALYLPPAIIEPLIFRSPVSARTYPVEIWNKISKLPIGLAFLFSICIGIPICAAAMAQSWWEGWIARKIPGGDAGDLAFEIAFCAVALAFIPARWLERRFTGR